LRIDESRYDPSTPSQRGLGGRGYDLSRTHRMYGVVRLSHTKGLGVISMRTGEEPQHCYAVA